MQQLVLWTSPATSTSYLSIQVCEGPSSPHTGRCACRCEHSHSWPSCIVPRALSSTVLLSPSPCIHHPPGTWMCTSRDHANTAFHMSHPRIALRYLPIALISPLTISICEITFTHILNAFPIMPTAFSALTLQISRDQGFYSTSVLFSSHRQASTGRQHSHRGWVTRWSWWEAPSAAVVFTAKMINHSPSVPTPTCSHSPWQLIRYATNVYASTYPRKDDTKSKIWAPAYCMTWHCTNVNCSYRAQALRPWCAAALQHLLLVREIVLNFNGCILNSLDWSNVWKMGLSLIEYKKFA